MAPITSSSSSLALAAAMALLAYLLHRQQQQYASLLALSAAASQLPAAQPALQQQQQAMIVVKPQYTSEYKQLGYLSDDQSKTLPLFGRRSLTSRDRFQYYVLTTDQQPVKLLFRHNGSNCADERGCSEITDGEQLTIDEFGGRSFKVTLYPPESLRYDPNSF